MKTTASKNLSKIHTRKRVRKQFWKKSFKIQSYNFEFQKLKIIYFKFVFDIITILFLCNLYVIILVIEEFGFLIKNKLF